MFAHLWWYLDPISPLEKIEQKKKKNVVKVGPPLTKLSVSALVSACTCFQWRQLINYFVENRGNDIS